MVTGQAPVTLELRNNYNTAALLLTAAAKKFRYVIESLLLILRHCCCVDIAVVILLDASPPLLFDQSPWVVCSAPPPSALLQLPILLPISFNMSLRHNFCCGTSAAYNVSHRSRWVICPTPPPSSTRPISFNNSFFCPPNPQTRVRGWSVTIDHYVFTCNTAARLLRTTRVLSIAVGYFARRPHPAPPCSPTNKFQ